MTLETGRVGCAQGYMWTRLSNLNGRGSASGHELTSPDGDVFARRKALGEMPKAALTERLKWAASLNPHFIPISVIVRSFRTSVNATRHCSRRRNRTHPPTVTPHSLKSRCRYRTEILCAWAIVEGDKSGSSSLFFNECPNALDQARLGILVQRFLVLCQRRTEHI